MNASLTTAADVKYLSSVREFVFNYAKRVFAEEDWLYELTLAVDEAVTNVIQHGYAESGGLIRIQIESIPNGLQIIIHDTAPSFDPTIYPEPNLPTDLDERKPGGIGIYMMRKLTDKVDYCCLPDGHNELHLIKYFPLPE